MRIVTIVSLSASAVLGLGALFVAKAVLPHAAAAKAPAFRDRPGVPVVVASRDIRYGTRLDAGMLSVVKAPADVAPQGAFSSVGQALGADHGGPPVALVPMSAREAVLPAKLSGPGARPSVAAEVAEGQRAYTVKVTEVTGVGGHALPGDRVDVVLMRDLTPEGQQRSFISYVVLQNVRVLGVDLNADLTSEKPANPNTATLEVSPGDAQKLSIAATLGTLSLALRRTGSAEVEHAGPLRTADFLTGSGAPRVRLAGGGGHTYSAILIVEGQPSKHPRPTAKKAAASGGIPSVAGAAAGAGAASSLPAAPAFGALS